MSGLLLQMLAVLGGISVLLTLGMLWFTTLAAVKAEARANTPAAEPSDYDTVVRLMVPLREMEAQNNDEDDFALWQRQVES